MSAITWIELSGVATHNLKHIDVRIPHQHLTVITGVSGSGKSSLALATLYAEGRRRFLQSLSSYSRQFLAAVRKPDLEAVRGIPPAIAFEQKNTVRHARSTVGTASEINDYLKLLFATIGAVHCPDCGREAVLDTPTAVVDRILALPEISEVYLVLNVPCRPETWPRLRQHYTQLGYSYIFSQGRRCPADELSHWSHSLWPVLLDRVHLKRTARARILASVEEAFAHSDGHLTVYDKSSGLLSASAGLQCPNCHRRFSPPEPQTFSFNSPLGACPRCQGYGRLIDIDMERAIHQQSALAFGAVIPFQQSSAQHWQTALLRYCQALHIPTHIPYGSLKPAHQRLIEDGDSRHEWAGIRGFFKQLESKRYRVHVRVFLARYRAYRPCPDCRGQRLRTEAQWVKVNGKSVGDLWELPLPALLQCLESLSLTPAQHARVHTVWQEICRRLRYLRDIGLGYLNLGRATRSLSGGESQRLRIASALGHGLTQSLYVLDEPTVGLHARDVEGMVRVLKQLVALGNTVVVVEHAPEVIGQADYIIELGPAAGENGGGIVAAGFVNPKNVVGGKKKFPGPRNFPTESLRRRFRPHAIPGWIKIRGARARNLKNIHVRIPLERLVCVSGVSGSGKTTLLKHVFWGTVQYQKGITDLERGECSGIEGLEQLDEVLWVDQSLGGSSGRSLPVTQTDAYTHIRALLARLPDAKAAHLRAGHFSFNVAGGRCAACEGRGETTYDMQFMDDIKLECDQCRGQRFSRQTLAIRYRGKHIHDLLNMTVSEAMTFFSDQAPITRCLQPLLDVGLGYLRLGQPSSTLSGGEAQRLKLAAVLAKKKSGRRTLILMDEPTTGLHHRDIQKLLGVFDQLLRDGHSLVVIEHHLDFLRCCDYLIDLGPEGAAQGGQIVAEGPMPRVLKQSQSLTVRYLIGIGR